MKRFIILAFMLIFTSIFWLPSLANAQQKKIPEIEIQNQFEHASDKGFSKKWLYFEGIKSPNEIISNAKNGKIIKSPIKEDLVKSSSEVTFAFYLKIPRENVGKMLEIHIPNSYSTSKIFIDEKPIISVEENKRMYYKHQLKLSPDIIFFRPDKTKILVTVQISNYSTSKMEVLQPLYIGVAAHEVNSWNSEFFWNCLLVGCNLMIGLFFISIGLYRSYGRDILIFGFFCIAVVVRAFFGVPYIYTIIMPNYSWEIALKMEYLFTCIATFFFIWLIYTVSESLFNKKILKFTNFLLLVLTVTIIFTDSKIYQPVFFTLYMWAVPTLVYVVYILNKSVRLKNKLAISHAVGIVFVFVAVLLDYISGLGIIHAPPLTFVGTTLYVLVQMVFLSKKFSYEVSSRIKLNMELIELNHSLDKKIDIRTNELQQANELLQKLAIRDGLTDIYNRHYFNEFMTKEFKLAQENHTPLALCIIDVDDFKKYNDFYGHIAGDELLKILARKMDDVIPIGSMLARYGGEEFAVVMPNTPNEVAIKLAQNLQKIIVAEKMIHKACDKGVITVSIGVATLQCSTVYTTVNDFIDAADQNLYKGKKAGKNTVVY